MEDQDLKTDNLMPGHMVYADHYILRALDRLYHIKGKSYPSEILSVRYVFISHARGYVSIKHKVAINDTETARAKLTLEREDEIQGVTIKGYHTNDGIFNALEFM